MVEGGQLYVVRTDHIGRPVFATNDAGAVVWSATYYPFGGVRVTQGTPIGLRFPGQWFQAESGLYQDWMRDYDPTTGRYIQPDPLGLDGGVALYGYALQSPMVWTDPTGQFVAAPWAILGGIAIGAGLDFLWQMYRNGGDIDCVNWAEVGLAGAAGAFGGAWWHAWHKGLTGANGLTSLDWQKATLMFKTSMGYPTSHVSHHGIVLALKNHPRDWRNAWWNLRALPGEIHDGVHGQFGQPRFDPFRRWYYGTPQWLLGAQGSAWIGTGAQFALGRRCGCDN